MQETPNEMTTGIGAGSRPHQSFEPLPTKLRFGKVAIDETGTNDDLLSKFGTQSRQRSIAGG